MTPEIYDSVNKVVNSALEEIAPQKKESDKNGLRLLEQWKEFDYHDRNLWIKIMKILIIIITHYNVDE
jgi:hypothetical protein